MERRFTAGVVVAKLEDKTSQIMPGEPVWFLTKACVWNLIVDVVGMGRISLSTTEAHYQRSKIGDEVGVEYLEVSDDQACVPRVLFELPEELRRVPA
jgi:hypothetical protein